MSQMPWEARYQRSPRLFGRTPNPTLVAETAHLTPGRALDIGCGEGGDAIWLAAHGWQVTGIDIAPTALQRGVREGSVAERITWLECDITEAAPPTGPFDLVTMHYVPLRTADANRALPGLLSTVAPGGTLLFVTHDPGDLTAQGDFDPSDYCQPDDIAKRLGPEWTITVQQRRRRSGDTARSTRHTHDAILSARRDR